MSILSDCRHRHQNRNVNLKHCGVRNYTTVNQGLCSDREMFIHQKWQREKEMWPIVLLWRRKPQVNVYHVKITFQLRDEGILNRTRYKCGINLNKLLTTWISTKPVNFVLTKEIEKIFFFTILKDDLLFRSLSIMWLPKLEDNRTCCYGSKQTTGDTDMSLVTW